MKPFFAALLLMALAMPLLVGCDRSSSVAATTPIGSSGLPHREARSAGGYLERTFDDVKFEMELEEPFRRAMLTPQIEKLLGNKVRIRGYIYPTLKKRGLKQFVLVRDNLECCFGPGAALFDCMLVHMRPGKTAEYSIYPVAVEGKLSFEEFKDHEGVTRAIYRLDGDAVN